MWDASTRRRDRLQESVDALADRLGRPVLVDDAHLRPLAYSPQAPDRVDRVRAVSILSRQAPAEAADYLLGHGIATAADLVHVPGSAEIGLDARVCAPILVDGRTTAYLWVVDGRQPLTGDELGLIRRLSEGIAAQMDDEDRPLGEHTRRRLVDALLSSDAGVSCDAAADLIGAGAFGSASACAALVALPLAPAGEQVDEAVGVLLSGSLRALAGGHGTRRRLAVNRGDHVVLLAEEPAGGDADRLLALGERLRTDVLEALPPGWDAAVGIGSAAPSLAGASRSFGEAHRAAAVAARIPTVDRVLDWASMGIYRLLSPPAGGRLDPDALPAGLVALMRHPGGEMLLETLETYLDRGGDAQLTTAELFLARGSLYYRLHRIEEITGMSLRSGHDRLSLHLGLKLARLAGLHPAPEAEPATAAASASA